MQRLRSLTLAWVLVVASVLVTLVPVRSLAAEDASAGAPT